MENDNNNLDMSFDEIEMPARYPSEEDLEFPVLAMDAENNDELPAIPSLNEDEINETVNEAVEMESIVSDEVLWQARTGLNSDTLCGAIETIIFMNDRPVSIQKIKQLIDPEIPLKVIHEALLRLQAEYEQKHHGIRLLEVAEGYQYRTKATYSKYVQDIFKINSLVLSPTALEVLAIIAYKQPCSKVEVDKIRGVDSGHIVRALMDKRLVKVNGRSDELGRPVLYGTTPEFLEVFNLPDLAALPPEHELDEMSRASSVGRIADIKSIVNDGADKTRFKFDEIDELDALSEQIKNINSETEFTSSLKVEEKKRMTEEGVEIKSAFDLLEEFVNKRLITEQNKQALESMMASAGVLEPKVIEDLEAGPFNVPEFIEDEEDFQMIDLDTGLPIDPDSDEGFDLMDGIELDEDGNYDSGLDESEFDILVELDLDEEEASLSSEDSNELDLQFDTEESEEEALSKALDAAFENLTGENVNSNRLSDEEFAFGGELDEKDQDIDDITNNMIKNARDLDLDLSFLNTESDKDND